MWGTFTTQGEDEKYVQNFSLQIWREETNWKHMLWCEYHITIKIGAKFYILVADQFLKSALYLITWMVQNRE
jgi:hypothetical protein